LILTLKKVPSQKEIEIQIKYAQMDANVKRIISSIQSCDKTLNVHAENKHYKVNVRDIFYIESVDKKTFVYCKEQVFGSNLRLYELHNQLSKYDFIQVSKSCILNMNVLKSIERRLNSTMEAMLINGEKINISRKYIPHIKTWLSQEENL
jgi:DNA-binding LytR/AlgR family response regulator